MKSNAKKRQMVNESKGDNKPMKENIKKAKGNPFWKKKKKEKEEEDDNFEEVKADAPTNIRHNEDSSSR